MTRKKVGKAVSNRPLRACRVESIYFVWETPKHNSAGRVRTTVRLNVSHSTEDVNAGTQQTRLRLQIRTSNETVFPRRSSRPMGASCYAFGSAIRPMARSGSTASQATARERLPHRANQGGYSAFRLQPPSWAPWTRMEPCMFCSPGGGQAGFDVEAAIAAHREPLDLPASSWCSSWRRPSPPGSGAKNAAIARIHVARNRRECAPCVYTRSSSYGQTGFPFCFLHSRSGFSKRGSRHGGCP